MAGKSDRDPFVQAVTMLRAHLVKCFECRYAYNTNEPNGVCLTGVMLGMQVAKSCDKMFALKRKAVSTINNYVYACPDVASHGEAYALTAQPLAVVATQDELF